MEGKIAITVNGEARQAPPGLSIEGLLEFLEVNPSRVAVERNREIVRREMCSRTSVEAGDGIEVVWFVGGGSRPPVDIRVQLSTIEKIR